MHNDGEKWKENSRRVQQLFKVSLPILREGQLVLIVAAYIHV